MDEELDRNFEMWYLALHPRLVTMLMGALGDPEVGRDAADEAFARAYERWPSVSKMDSPDAWTYRVAVNVAKRRWRRRAVERRVLRTAGLDASMPGPAGELWLLVNQLPPRQRLAVLLRHVGHLTEEEIATAMGVKRGTVSATLRAAYHRLRLDVEADMEETNHA